MKERIGALDGWRGIAVLLVVVDHAAEMSGSGWIHRVTRTGATGVGLFFAMSGFLITSLLLEEQTRHGRIRLGAFFVRRFFRIVPSMVVFLAVILCLRQLNILQVTWLHISSCVLLFRNYLGGDWGAGWYTGHFWSLMVEWHFYLLWPFLLRLTKAKLPVLISLALAVAGWRAISLHYHLLPGPWAPGRTDIRIDSLLWGCILAIAFTRPRIREKLKGWTPAWAMLLLVLVDVASNVIHGQQNYSAYEPPILALLVVWPLLHPANALRRFLDRPWLCFLGRISYSVYIWQQIWLLFPGTPMPFPRLQTFPVNVALAFACGIASYFVVEEPFIRLGKRAASFAVRRSPQPAMAD